VKSCEVQLVLAASFTLVYYLAYPSTVMMQRETLVHFHRTESCFIPEHRPLHSLHCEDTKLRLQFSLWISRLSCSALKHQVHLNNIILFLPCREHFISITKPNRLMLFGKTAAVYCENHTEHTNTLCEQYAEFFNVKGSGTYSNH
jgi:hypothetical protein